MADFYLSIRNGESLTRDPQAYCFATAQAARDAAVQTMRDLLLTDPRGHAFDQIEITDETGHAISVVEIEDVLPSKRH